MASHERRSNAHSNFLRGKMRILSVRQPWAELIVSGIKRIENRTWTTSYRGPVIIHAGGKWDDEPIEQIERRLNLEIPYNLPRGGVVGIAGLADVVTVSADPFFTGPFGFVMVGAQRLPFMPIPGALGLRTAPPTMADRIDPTILKKVDEAVRHRAK